MIKWEREHHQRKEEEKPISSAGDVADMPIMRERNIAPLVVMGDRGASAVTAGKNE